VLITTLQLLNRGTSRNFRGRSLTLRTIACVQGAYKRTCRIIIAGSNACNPKKIYNYHEHTNGHGKHY